jgi:hypothetical protein
MIKWMIVKWSMLIMDGYGCSWMIEWMIVKWSMLIVDGYG